MWTRWTPIEGSGGVRCRQTASRTFFWVNLHAVNKASIFIPLLLAVLLSACESVPERPAPAPASPVAVKLPFAEPPPAPPVKLDGDLVYDYLVAEIASREGDFKTALDHYLQAAVLARDPYAAERATRIALHLGEVKRGLIAAREWVKLEPNSMAARLLYALLYLRDDQPTLASQQLRALLEISDARGKDGLLQIAVILNDEKNAAGALAVMQSLVAQRENDPDALYALAVMQFARNLYADAEHNLRRAISLKPDWAQPRVLLSQVLVAQHHTDQALAGLATAVQAHPKEALLRIEYVRLLVQQKRYQDALVQLRVLNRLEPKNAEVTLEYAMLATQQHQWQEARDLWNTLLPNEDFHDEAAYFLAQVEERTGHPAKAIALYNRVGDGDLKPDALIRMGILLGREGKLDRALEILGDARLAYPDRAADIYLTEGLVLQQAHVSPARIERLYAQALKAYPDDTDLLYNRGLYYADIGKLALMEKDFQAVLKADPDNADALNALGYTLADHGLRLNQAYTYVRHALALKPGNPAILDSLGWVYYRKGDFAQAVNYLRKALDGEPNDEIAAHLVEALWADGEHGEAKKVLRKAVSRDPQSDALRALQQRLGKP